MHDLAAIAERDARLRHIHYDWLDAAERTQATVRQLSEQLRRFLDDQVWFGNRRVIEILRGIESHALRLREQSAVPITMELDAPSPKISLPMERPLYTRARKPQVSSVGVRDADEETDVTALFEQVYVDPGPLRAPSPLRAEIHRALRRQPTIGLARIVEETPLTQGLAEQLPQLQCRGLRRWCLARRRIRWPTARLTAMRTTRFSRRMRADSRRPARR